MRIWKKVYYVTARTRESVSTQGKRTGMLKKLVPTLIAIMLLLPFLPAANAAGYGYNAYLKMTLATRTGPGTWYDEPGTFFSKNYRDTSVRVLSKAWDDRNSIWWLQVEFYRNSTPYRAYTGLKRVDIDISDVPDERVLGTAVTQRSAAGYWGPGTEYASSKYDIPSGYQRLFRILLLSAGASKILVCHAW